MNDEFTPETEATESDSPPTLLGSVRQFWGRYKAGIGIGILFLYVALLGLGTVGEVWDVEWILDLPLFRPPGKY
ncbi:MAG: hypothetical protein GWO19_25285 [Nitrospinaceae bacterium]|nr:hypothetical protein [Nitrospinaceae bacterium]NIU99146.1 hypothetical protein [Nitrospinaceae bacterium]